MAVRTRVVLGASSLVMALFMAPAALAQDANDPAVQQAYADFAATQDETTQQALADACVNAGFSGLDDCVAAITGQTPVEEQPSEDQPAVDEPVTEESSVEEPAPEEPTVEESSSEEPVIEEPAPEEPSVEEPSSEEPTVEESSEPEPVVEEPSSDEPVVDDTSSEEPAVDAASSEEPVADEPTTDQSASDEPTSEEPSAPEEQPISEMPNADEPVTVDAVEVLPSEIAPEEAAPILDSIKDVTNSGDESSAPADDQPLDPPSEAPPPPQDDSAAQADIAPPPSGEFSVTTDEGERQPDTFVFVEPPPPPKVKVIEPPPQADGGIIFQIGINIYINNPQQERSRYYDPDQDEIYYEQLSRGRVRETITRPSGVMIVTVYDRYGDVLQRSKILPDGREIYLATYDPEEESDFADWRDPGDELPPLVLKIPARDYILDADFADDDEVYDFLDRPPVEHVRRIYSIDEVKRSARLRDMVRRLEVGGLTFDSGKATISRSQVGALEKVANAMQRLLDKNPGEVFLIEGHTDAIGSAVSNLVLSDKRAATVARILTDFYDIPPENLATQGYGERYLKVKTEEAERLNRRVTIKRITPLVSYEALSN